MFLVGIGKELVAHNDARVVASHPRTTGTGGTSTRLSPAEIIARLILEWRECERAIRTEGEDGQLTGLFGYRSLAAKYCRCGLVLL